MQVGRCGRLIEQSVHTECILHIRDTANRGPYAVHGDRMRILNYFDEEHFSLGYDDHDLSARALQRGWHVGMVPLAFDAPLRYGKHRLADRTREQGSFWASVPKKSTLKETRVFSCPRYYRH